MRRLAWPRVEPSGVAVSATYLGFLAVSLLQQPGRTTYDTRLELTERPASFLASVFSLWQPGVNFGEVQNQASGYLFPLGPFFWLGHVLHVAPWVTQRVWTALVLVAACEGARRLARALDLPVSAAFLGGLVFAFSPRLLGTSGVLTGEALPGAMAPWAVLPIVLTARGRLAARPAVVLSIAAVVAMGGVNAVETAGAVVPAALVVVWGTARRVLSWRVGAGWLGGLVLATLWWTLPLLVLSRYSPPFYQYVESAANTTSLVGWSEAVRGDTHWLSWLLLPDGRPWWPAAHMVATSPVLVAVSAVVAAVGFTGLARWASPWRVPFAFSAAVGLAMVTVAHGGLAGSPVAGDARALLDGALQIFRNVHKFDPPVRLAVALGVAAAFAEFVVRADRRFRPGAAAPWVVVPACLVLALGTPFLVDEGRTPGWKQIPSAWADLRAWLAGHDDGGSVLVVPGSGFAIQPWGSTYDEPALAVDLPGRVALTQAPLLPGPTLRFLSALNGSITSGGGQALADELARAGISHVVLRQDLDRVETGTPSPILSESALAAPGIEKVRTFRSGDSAPLTLYRVERFEPRLRLTAADDVRTVAGEPESVLPLQEMGLLSGAAVLAGEPGWTRRPDVVTDGAKRRERQFGALYDAQSVVLGAGEDYRVPRAAHEYAGAPGAAQVVSRFDGLASLRASSSRGYADTYGETVLAEGPAAAIDDSASTRWVTSPSTRPQDQWLRMTFSAPRSVHEVQIQPVVGDPFLSPVRRLAVIAGAQRRVVDVDPDGGTVTVGFDGSRVASVTVRILRSGTVGRAPVALAGVHVDGLDPRPTLVVPEPLADGASFAFTTGADVRPCLASAFGPDCDERRRRTPEEPEGLDRTVSVPDGASVDVSGLVVARPTPRARRLLEPVGREQRVKASSVFGSDPRVASRFAWDGSASTAWVPADTDPGPTLTFRWQRARTVSGLRVEAPDAQTAPVRALLTTAAGEHRAVSVSGSAMVSFPSLTTRRLSVTFERPAEGARLVVGDVSLRGADVTQPFDADAVTGAICGLGPHIVVDGVTYQSEVRGTLGDVVDGRPLRLRVCGRTADGRADPGVRLAPGSHRISAPPTSEFETVALAGQGQVPSVSTARSMQLESWRGVQRSAHIGPGAESVVSMPSNASPGWRATLDGRALRPVRVDGWQQAWIVPAGSGGRLVIDYPPQHWYGALVGASTVPAALLLLGALLLLVGRRRAGRRQVPALGPPRPRASAALTAVLLVGLGGAAAVGTVLALVGRRRAWPALVGGLGLLAAGLLDVRDPALPTDGVADVLAAVGFGLVLGTAVRGGEEGP